MSRLQDLASKLADDVLAVMDKSGDDRLFYEVASVMGASSQTMEEAFMTEIRLRLAERQAREFLRERIAKYKADIAAKGDG